MAETTLPLEEQQQRLAALERLSVEAEVAGLIEAAQTLRQQAAGLRTLLGGEAGASPLPAVTIGRANVVIIGDDARVGPDETPVATPAVDHDTALSRYLQYLIGANRYLPLQGIRASGQLVHVELERIYITLRATRQRAVEGDPAGPEEEAGRAPGEHDLRAGPVTETVTVSVNEALTAHRRLVVLGDPGSGKTTLLRYLALCYARDLAEGTREVAERLGLAVSGLLPIFLSLRQLGAFLQSRRPVEDGTEGPRQLLDHLDARLRNECVDLPAGFFTPYLEQGRAVVLLDGLDEVADPNLRRRVARLVESFTAAYSACHYVVTSRVVGYTGPARLGEEYVTTTVQGFIRSDIETFLQHWHQAIAVGERGPGPSAQAHAAAQTRALLGAIQANERIRELALNPLLLTVIALVHRERVQIPDRRVELYDEAVNVFLGKWEEAKGVGEQPFLEDRVLDTGEKRLLLQVVALWMQERALKEIEAGDLQPLLAGLLRPMVPDDRGAARAGERFLQVIRERAGLLGEAGVGVYRFSHLTFQEYLAALAVAGRDDYVAYTLARSADPGWREVILLAAGHLSTQSRERTTRLIRAISEAREEPLPYHNLVLAADCLRDVGAGRVEGDLLGEVQRQLRQGLESPPPLLARLWRRLGIRGWVERRSAAAEALARSGGGYWTPPYGEPEWVEVPAGEFWMGTRAEDVSSLLRRFGEVHSKWYTREIPQHRVQLPPFAIARVPITNAQYHLFAQATGHEPPRHWAEGRPPKGHESHPVGNVSWHDALAYCDWLSQVTGKQITLPSEAQWEKAGRGDRDRRTYPWGDKFEATRCNCRELWPIGTTPVGIFPEGASPYGVLDLAGNIWEWTSSLYQDYPYQIDDGREDLASDGARVLRGGAFGGDEAYVRCACRVRAHPHHLLQGLGFRVVLSPLE